jgi:hypothetical protein
LDYYDDEHGVCGTDGAVLAWKNLFARLDPVMQVPEQVVEVVVSVIGLIAGVTTDPLKDISQRSDAVAPAVRKRVGRRRAGGNIWSVGRRWRGQDEAGIYDVLIDM